jgi:hypothetical protein
VVLAAAGLVACGPGTPQGSRRDPGAPSLFVAPAPAGSPRLDAAFAFPELLAVETPPLGDTAPPAAETRPSACNEQAPQAFLIRSTYAFQPTLGPEATKTRKRLHREAIEYRTRRYGYVEGYGEPSWNRLKPQDYAGVATFFGVRVRMNARVLVALGCVENTIEDVCSETPYMPRMLDGLRAKNTFHNNEVSNHLYGIAIDIDPDKNACCGCLAPASDAPICRKPASTPFDRASIPKCWVDVFERYGFYWLGHDVLEDTMHFEFLGDPDKIAS